MFEDALLTPEKIEAINLEAERAARDYANATEGNFKQEDIEAIYRDADMRKAKAQHLATLKAVVEAAEKGMPICPPMNDREDIVVSLTNQRQACIDWLKKSMEE